MKTLERQLADYGERQRELYGPISLDEIVTRGSLAASVDSANGSRGAEVREHPGDDLRVEPRGDALTFDSGWHVDESTAPSERKRWIGPLTAVAAAVLVVAAVVVVADRNSGNVVTDPATQVPSPSVDEATTSPDVTDAAAAPSVVDPVSLYRWSRVPDADGAFAYAGIYEPGFGGHDSAAYSEWAQRVMVSVTVGGPGLVAVGVSGVGGAIETDNSDAAVWTSDDGATWSPVPHVGTDFGGFADQQMTGVTTGGPGLVAVGSDRSKWFSDGVAEWNRERAAVWTSVDGITWSRVAHDESVFGGAGARRMNSVTVGGPGLVAVGSQSKTVLTDTTPDPPDPDEEDLDAAVWVSVDGITWSRVAHDEAIFGGAGPQQMTSVTAGGPGLVAVGTDGLGNTVDAAVWTSVDGITWSRVPDDAMVLGGANSQQMASVTTGGPGLVAVGYDGIWDKEDREDGEIWDWAFVGAAAVWTSVDGTTWTLVSDDAAVFGGANSTQMNSVTTGGPGLVAVGIEKLEGTNDWRSVVWTSVDGITWSRVPDDETVFGGPNFDRTRIDLRRVWGAEMTSVTSWGPALVAVGDVEACCLEVGARDAAVWVATPEN